MLLRTWRSPVHVCNHLEFNPQEFKLREFRLCRKVLCLQMCLRHPTHLQCHRGLCHCLCLRQMLQWRCTPSKFPQHPRTRKLHRGLTGWDWPMNVETHSRQLRRPRFREPKLLSFAATWARQWTLRWWQKRWRRRWKLQACHIPLVRATDQQDMYKAWPASDAQQEKSRHPTTSPGVVADCNPWKWWGRWQADASDSWWCCGWCDDGRK